MTHSVSHTIVIDANPEVVFKELIDLRRHHIWNNGMISTTPTTLLEEGNTYQAKYVVLGKETVSEYQVSKLIPGERLETKSDYGVIPFQSIYEIKSIGTNQTEVHYQIKFELVGIALNFAQPLIESLAAQRVQGNLEMLKAMIEADATADNS